MNVKDLVGMQDWELAAHTPVGVKIVKFEIEPVMNVVSVVLNAEGIVTAAVSGVIQRIKEEQE